jgi:hypothetical protein
MNSTLYIYIIIEMLNWPLPYIKHRLSTAYGSHYTKYILRHPIRFCKDLYHYIEWCIMIDRLR